MQNRDIIKQLAGNGRALTKTSAFKHRCSCCGECCKKFSNTLVSSYDLFRIAKYLKMQPIDVFQKYFRPILAFGVVPTLDFKRNGIVHACIFLNDNRCSINEVKPYICRVFPVTPSLLSEGMIHILNYDCSNVDKGISYTLNKWLQRLSKAEHERFHSFFSATAMISNYLHKINEIIGRENCTEQAEILLGNIFGHLYLVYDIDKGYDDQFQRNVGNIRADFDAFLDDRTIPKYD